MTVLTFLMALAASPEAPGPPPPVQARAQTQVFVQIIQAAEVRSGKSSSPHQRTIRLDENGQKLVLLEFE